MTEPERKINWDPIVQPRKITVDDMLRNPRPISRAITDAANRSIHAENMERERKGREMTLFVASFFASKADERARLDPRRIGERFVVRQCRKWVSVSEKRGAGMVAPIAGGKVIYEREWMPCGSSIVEGRCENCDVAVGEPCPPDMEG